jgi:hypothetical protein
MGLLATGRANQLSHASFAFHQPVSGLFLKLGDTPTDKLCCAPALLMAKDAKERAI